MALQRFCVGLTPEELEWAGELAARQGIARTTLVRHAVREGLKAIDGNRFRAPTKGDHDDEKD